MIKHQFYGDSEAGSESDSSGSANEAEEELMAYGLDSNRYANNWMRRGDMDPPNSRFTKSARERAGELYDIVEGLPDSGNVPLYRGGSEGRGTSGLKFQNGTVRQGDILVTTDFASFTEVPEAVNQFAGNNLEPPSFDETSVVFEVPAPKNAKIFSPYSPHSEGENLYL